MFEKFDVYFSQLPTDEETLRAKRELPAELQDLAGRDLKRVVLDPEKSAETIKKLVMLAVGPEAGDASSSSPQVSAARAVDASRTVDPSRPTRIGPQIGVEPCVYITVGFIWPCGTMRIGGCS